MPACLSEAHFFVGEVSEKLSRASMNEVISNIAKLPEEGEILRLADSAEQFGAAAREMIEVIGRHALRD